MTVWSVGPNEAKSVIHKGILVELIGDEVEADNLLSHQVDRDRDQVVMGRKVGTTSGRDLGMEYRGRSEKEKE